MVLHRRPTAPDARIYESNVKLSDAVAADPNGIGVFGLAYARSTRPLTIVQGCGLAVPAEPFMVRTEEYPLTRRLFLYSPAEPTQPAVNFLNFASSAKAQPAIAAAGFVTLAPELSTTSYSELRKRNAPEMFATPGTVMDPKQSQPIVQGLRALFSESQRLSITFRFQLDSAALDTRGEADIERLVAWSNEPANASRQFVLVGYGSSIGSFAPNVALSRTRADTLVHRLQAAGLRSVSAIGAGSVGAVACNADARGQALNRRVEVWVK
jgi:phosphate transport system substrate-binding protein